MYNPELILIKNTARFISSRAFYFGLGLFLSVAIMSAYAAWNSTVNPGDTLTPALWNDMVAKLVEHETEINNFSCTLGAVTWVGKNSCPAGQIATDFQWRGSGDNHIIDVGCRPITCN